MFGTGSVLAEDTCCRRTSTDTACQTAMLFARTMAMTGAFANMSIQTGINMSSSIGPASIFGWTGGPAIDDVFQLKRVLDVPVDQKADALKILGRQVGRLSLPGQSFYNDLRRSLSANSPREGALMMMLGKPIDHFNHGL